MAGCAVARALALADPERRRRILLIDRHTGGSPRFAGEFIHPRGAQILDELGFMDPLLRAGGVEVDGFTVLERADGRCVELPYSDAPGVRARGLAIHHRALVPTMRALLTTCPLSKDHVELREGVVLTSLRRDARGRICGATLTDRDRRTVQISADTIIGADGKGSTTRKLAGIAGERETVGFTVGLLLDDASVPSPTHGNVILGARGPVLVYPIERSEGGGLRYRMTLDLPHNLPARGAGLADYLMEAFVPFLPTPLAEQTADAIACSIQTGARLEIAPTVSLNAPCATMPGLALIGDAAGCSHPITASGMTMGLRDAEVLGAEATRRRDSPAGQAWLDDTSLRHYRSEHDRYVPTRQALATAIYEAFRGGDEGARMIQRALFEYWTQSSEARARSMALLSCAESRPSVFLSEYVKAAGHALHSSLSPRHASHFPVEDRIRQMKGAALLARSKLGSVASVVWAQVRPEWLPRASA
jgi:2-polyprenyl-6-methoxyphenol hydroxylase-like FAD-dependent oxidoreductase